MKRLSFTLGLLLLASAPALAQNHQWNPYSTTVYREGPGLRVGNVPLVFHPGFIAEGGYDSNIFYRPYNEFGAGVLRLRAHLDIATLPPQRLEGDIGTADPKVEFRFSTQIEYREYLTSFPPAQAQRSVNLFGSADLIILPRGPFTLRIGDTYIRTVDPRNLEGPLSYNRNANTFSLLATYRPGSGRLELGLGDRFDISFWENRDIGRLGDVISNEARAFVSFRFLLQTIATLQVRAGYVKYLKPPGSPPLEAAPIRATLGVTSLITSWFGVAAAIGYGNSLHFTGARFSHVLAQLEARFFLPRGSRVALGYDRDFFDSMFANFYVDDYLYLRFDQPIMRRLSASLSGGVRFRHYDGLLAPADVGYVDYVPSMTRTRDDMVYDGRAEVSVLATSWLSLAMSYNLIGDRSDFAFVDAAGAPTPVRFIKHSAFARVNFAY